VSNILYIVASVVGFAFVAVVVNETWKRHKNNRFEKELHRKQQRRSRYEYAHALTSPVSLSLHRMNLLSSDGKGFKSKRPQQAVG
jgi:hypothetical protein